MSLKGSIAIFYEVQKALGMRGALSVALDDGKKKFVELGKSSGSFFSTSLGKITIATTATYALVKSIQAVSDKYNLSYDSSIKNTKKSLDGLQSTKNEIENLKSKAESYKQTLMSMGEILEGVLDQEIDEELGYSKYDYQNKETDNSRNGHSQKTMHTSSV